MDDFRQSYLELCQEYQVEPQSCVLDKIPESGRLSGSYGKITLDLTSASLTSKTCAVIGKALQTDRSVKSVKFADCMLPEDAVKAIVCSLTSNVACQKVDLKGNNIRGPGTEALGDFLRNNTSVTSLCLEWNSLGMLDTEFSSFAQGLGMNKTLEHLDLRNNQINHGGGEDLGRALKKNTTLRTLDLRWNNVGNKGATAILSALQYNRTLVKVELAGNTILPETQQAIETALAHNIDRQSLENDYCARTKLLSSELKNVRKEGTLRMSDLRDQLDKQKQTMQYTTRSTSEKIAKLKEALDEKSSACSCLESKLSRMESRLAMALQKSTDLSASVDQATRDRENIISKHQADRRREKDEMDGVRSRMLRDLADANERSVKQDDKITELEKARKEQKEEMFSLKEHLAHSQAEMKLNTTHCEEKLAYEKQRCREVIQTAEDQRLKEIAKLKQDTEDKHGIQNDKIQKLERTRIDLEEEASKCKTSIKAERVESDRRLNVEVQRLTTEADTRYKELEDHLRRSQQSKDELQQHSNHQSHKVGELHSKNGALQLEVEQLKRTNEDLNQELAGKSNEIAAAVSKVKLDLKQKESEIEQEKDAQKELQSTVTSLQKKLRDESLRHNDELEEKERRMTSLSEKCRNLETDMSRIRNEQTQKANHLQAVLTEYLRTSYSPTH